MLNKVAKLARKPNNPNVGEKTRKDTKRIVNSRRYIKWSGSCILQLSSEDEIEIKGALAAIEKEEIRFTIQREEQDLTRC